MEHTPHFSILTRTFPGREKLLTRCAASVAQTCARHPDLHIEHQILHDKHASGIPAAQTMFWEAEPRGAFVLVLDDDDFLVGPDALYNVHRLLPPDTRLAVVKVLHGELGVMPRAWRTLPGVGEITVSNVIVSNEAWLENRWAFTPNYSGDFGYIASLFFAEVPVWIDVPVVVVEKRRYGKAE